MPVKKNNRTLPPTKLPSTPLRAGSARSSKLETAKPSSLGFWTAFFIILLVAATAIIGYSVYLVYQEQKDLVLTLPAYRQTGSVDENARFQQTLVPGLFLAYTKCPAQFTGPCDDAMLYRLNADGSKQTIFPSMRALAGSPLTDELLQPIATSSDGKLIAFGAWSFGNNRNKSDLRAWIYDSQTGELAYDSDKVPQDAIFSPDLKYAAYGVLYNNDIQDFNIVNLKKNQVVSGGKANAGNTFMGQDGKPEIVWVDAGTVSINLFVKSMPDSPNTTEYGVKKVKVTQ